MVLLCCIVLPYVAVDQTECDLLLKVLALLARLLCLLADDLLLVRVLAREPRWVTAPLSAFPERL